MIATFLLLGWVFFELSGGTSFVPETREAVIAEAETTAPDTAPTPQVTRAATTQLVSISLPVTTAPVADAPADIVDEGAIAEAVAVADTIPVPAPEVTPVALTETVAAPAAPVAPAPVAAPVLDIRQVAGSRVNMRSGPSTDYRVLDTLDGGTETEVILVNADGWAQIRVISTGAEGWMAERLLTPG